MRVRRLAASICAAAIAVGGATAASASAGDGVGRSGTELGVDEVGRSANVDFLANTPHSGPLTGGIGSDLAFSDGKAFVGNYNGFVIYDIANPKAPRTVAQVAAPAPRTTSRVYGDLLFLSTDSSRSDDSCNSVAQPATVKESWEGIKIFDISDKREPAVHQVASRPTAARTPTRWCPERRTASTSTSPRTRRAPTFPDCQPPHDTISIIKVPLKAPDEAAVVATPVLFPDGGYHGHPPTRRLQTTGCHDITVYPAKDIAAGACMGDGILSTSPTRRHPKVIDRVQDNANFAFWHSATFNNGGTKVVFTDELGGGGAATCNEEVGPNRGADGIYDIVGKGDKRKLVFRSYFKIPRHQADTENCVAHNGSLIPVKGRTSWSRRGTRAASRSGTSPTPPTPEEIGYFERGPLAHAGHVGGAWSAYYYNGYIFSSTTSRRASTSSTSRTGA